MNGPGASQVTGGAGLSEDRLRSLMRVIQASDSVSDWSN